jgi:hypothetical protein
LRKPRGRLINAVRPERVEGPTLWYNGCFCFDALSMNGLGMDEMSDSYVEGGRSR